MAKNDKIFNNSFDTPEFELGAISFELDPSVKNNQDEEERIHYEMIARKIHELITASRFKVFNEIDDLGRCNKLKKNDINKVINKFQLKLAPFNFNFRIMKRQKKIYLNELNLFFGGENLMENDYDLITPYLKLIKRLS